jgi:hypothetical protein
MIVDHGGSVTVTVPGTIVTASGSTIDVSAVDATLDTITLISGGAMTLGGRLFAQATDPSGSGGTIDVTAGSTTTPGDITVNDRIRADGGGQGAGGNICLTALNGGSTTDGAITVNASLNASGGEFDGGCIDLEADGSIMVTGGAAGVTLDVSGGGLSGFGGLVMLNSNVTGDVAVNAPILGPGAGSLAEGGGDGGEVDAATTVGNVTVNSTINVTGGPLGGGGGTVDLEPTGDLAVTGPLLVSGSGAGTIGGDVIFFNNGATTLSALIDISATGLQSSAGTVSLNVPGVAGTTASLLPGCEINGDSDPATPANLGASIQLVDATIIDDANVHANGGGVINFQACTLTINADAQVQAQSSGANLLQASGPMQVSGTLLASTNTLDYFDPANPPNITGASITPAAMVALDQVDFPPLCPGQTTTTSTSTTTSTLATTTSTTLATTTTTTLGPTTTTIVIGTTSTTTTSTTTSTLATTSTTTTSTTTSTNRPATTTSTTRVPTTVTTTTAPPTASACVPPLCDDRGPCEPGACIDGECQYTPMAGLDGVGCRLDQVQGLLQAPPANAIHGRALGRKLVAKVAKLHHQVDAGRSGGRKGLKALRGADHGIGTFIVVIQSAAHAGKLDAGFAAKVVGAASDAKTTLDPLLTNAGARSAASVHRSTPPHGIEERRVVRLHRVPLGVRWARFEPERLDHAGVAVVARVDEEEEGRQEELIGRGELLEDLLRLGPGETGESGGAPLGGEIGDRREAVLEDRPEHRSLLDGAHDVGREAERAGSGEATVVARRDDVVDQALQDPLLECGEREGLVGHLPSPQSSKRFARFFFIVSAM